MIERFGLNLNIKEMKYFFSYQDYNEFFRIKKMKKLSRNTVDY